MRSLNIIFLFFFITVRSLYAQDVARERPPSLTVKTADITGQVDSLLKYSEEERTCRPEKALEFARQAFELADKNHLLPRKLEAMVNLAEINIMMTYNVNAMEMTLKARDLARELADKRNLGHTYRLQGKIHFLLGDYNKSSEYYFKALQLFEECRNDEGMFRTYNDIGVLYSYLGNDTKALENFTLVLKKATMLRDQKGLSYSLNNLGNLYEGKKNFKQAEKNFREALQISIQTHQLYYQAINHMNLARICQKTGNFHESADHYSKAMTIDSAMGNKYDLTLCYLNLFDYYNLQHDPGNAMRSLMKAYSLASENNLKGIKLQSAKKIHKFYKNEDRIDSAYKYAIIQFQVKDSMEIDNANSKLSLAELEYQYAKKEREEKFSQQRNQIFLITSIILALSLVIIIALFLSRQIIKTKNIYLEKQKLALEKTLLTEEVEFKNKELTVNVMNLLKKNEVIINISDQLLQMEKTGINESTRDEISRIIKALQKSADSDSWEEFEVRFREVHSDFYDKLIKQFPELTPNDLKICAFLRLNLSTKEITELTGQSQNAIEVARYRLRKKLGISNSQVNLVTFLSQI